jgi:hypothetical protein
MTEQKTHCVALFAGRRPDLRSDVVEPLEQRLQALTGADIHFEESDTGYMCQFSDGRDGLSLWISFFPAKKALIISLHQEPELPPGLAELKPLALMSDLADQVRDAVNMTLSAASGISEKRWLTPTEFKL